uniref:Secreted protein n=1 Tax=Panstrongylus lignarius TaxID=156445 RepID=A0A224XYA8_9HEMI
MSLSFLTGWTSLFGLILRIYVGRSVLVDACKSDRGVLYKSSSSISFFNFFFRFVSLSDNSIVFASHCRNVFSSSIICSTFIRGLIGSISVFGSGD